MVRLTERVDPPPPLQSAFRKFFLGCVKKQVIFGLKTLFQALFSGSKFSHLLTIRADHPPYSQPEYKIIFFDNFLYNRLDYKHWMDPHSLSQKSSTFPLHENISLSWLCNKVKAIFSSFLANLTLDMRGL